MYGITKPEYVFFLNCECLYNKFKIWNLHVDFNYLQHLIKVISLSMINPTCNKYILEKIKWTISKLFKKLQISIFADISNSNLIMINKCKNIKFTCK